MEKITNLLRKDVKIQTSHLWMVGLGTVIGLGFFVNCAIAPFVEVCTPIESKELIWAAFIISGLASLREIVLMRFKYLPDLKPMTKKQQETAEEILKERIWVPCVGWCLVIGYAVNMLVIPFANFRPVEWNFLHGATALFLFISGARETGVYWQQNEKRSKSAPQPTKE